MKIQIFEVGGSIRDSILGLKTKDRDFTVLTGSYKEMRDHLLILGAKIFLEKEEYFTIRCHLEPYGASDFVLARKEGYYEDGRRPSKVELASNIKEELNRRDFTCNAIAKDISTGEIYDYFGGVEDAKNKILRCVGSARERFTEDSLRLARAQRFFITKGFELDNEIKDCLVDKNITSLLKNISAERIREELDKCFRFDFHKTMKFLQEYPLLWDEFFNDRTKLWLKPTMEEQ